MHPSLRLLALSAAAVSAIVLAGCSGSATPDVSDEDESPLSVYLDAVYGTDLSDDEQQARASEDHAAREASIAACMREQGFSYVPDTQSAAALSSTAPWEPDARSWVAQYGYGAIAFPGSDEPLDPAAQWVDPNADDVSSLSESEQAAYFAALYGVSAQDGGVEEGTSGSGEGTDPGCHGRAVQETSRDDPLQDARFAPLREALDSLWSSESSWPGMSDLDVEWSACMEEAGYPGFAAQAEAQQSMFDAANALWDDSTADAPTDPGDPAMQELKEREIALALADLDCRERTDYRDRARAAQWEAEAAFVVAHRDELEALAAAAEQSS